MVDVTSKGFSHRLLIEQTKQSLVSQIDYFKKNWRMYRSALQKHRYKNIFHRSTIQAKN